MESTSAWMHSGNVGDVHASLPAMAEFHRQTGKQIILLLNSGNKGKYYAGATHPTKNENGEEVMLNDRMIEMMIPLYKAQPFIADCRKWDGEEEYKVNLDEIRRNFVNMPYGSINRWYFYVFPDLTCDLSKVWLSIPEARESFATGKILINLTERYRNAHINYEFLKPYEDDCLFVGTIREYHQFTMGNDLNIEKITVNSFLEYAQAIKQSNFYISNQSQGFQLAEGLKHPRILELCSFAPNVIPIGENAYDFYGQAGLEYAFHKLNGTLEAWLKTFKKENPADKQGLNTEND